MGAMAQDALPALEATLAKEKGVDEITKDAIRWALKEIRDDLAKR